MSPSLHHICTVLKLVIRQANCPVLVRREVTMIPVKKILFPADFSNRCGGAAHAVRTVARRFEAEVMPLHVLELASPKGVPEYLLNQAHQAMEALIADKFTGCKVIPCVTTGDPAVKIIEHALAGRFDLIMMPTHGYGPFRQFLLGAVTAKVLHDAVCPVWTSVHLEDWPLIENVMLRNILCGLDFGPRSSAALKYASQMAAEFKANLTVAHAIPRLETPASSPQWRDRVAKAAEERVRGIEEEIGVSARVEILDGSPAYGMSEVAERLNADLMIIGRTHVAADFAKLGSNAYAIIAHSPCPVLSV